MRYFQFWPQYFQVFQDRFREHGIPINIWSGGAQEDFMGGVLKLIHAYGLGRNQSDAHKQNQNPEERRIQEIKGTSRNVLDHSDTPSWSWIICMVYAVAILGCIAHRTLSWHTTHLGCSFPF